MAKLENVKVVSIGGKLGVPQQYAGTVGGQSLDFSAIDSDIKTAGLKNDPLAPPDFIINSYQGITWRLAQGAINKDEPEEWQSREASENYQLTAAVVNNPWAMWNDMAAKFFKIERGGVVLWINKRGCKIMSINMFEGVGTARRRGPLKKIYP
ncbi:hypothetical protein PM082_012095 [Marasmius tenuissimus]|nr:hypothetical protein PM082_012095 [Marasmius tenuissimus]